MVCGCETILTVSTTSTPVCWRTWGLCLKMSKAVVFELHLGVQFLSRQSARSGISSSTNQLKKCFLAASAEAAAQIQNVFADVCGIKAIPRLLRPVFKMTDCNKKPDADIKGQ
ncbi:hypothetical protein FQA47_007584 [Oryzias melastigma]|uniref:Uncharacterized protein n=1 Tax=Oryzias melastigma TaxID=30732 RepID=A0A834C3B0_ORYME|nr:hypothetical protein FQA47_007584 [Oryzias melastigma]